MKDLADISGLRLLCMATATLVGALAAPIAAASEPWPQRPVTMVIPFAPGGTTDIIGRLIGSKLSEQLKVSIVPENKGGAGGNIAANYVAAAPRDGYTVAMDHIGFAFNQSLNKNKGAIPQLQIEPVALVGTTPNVLVVTNGLAVNTLQEFIDYARKNPGVINYGSGGIGSAGHLPMELLQSLTGTEMTHVPYKGSGPALVDLVAGRIQAMLMTIPAVMGTIKQGQVRAIATTGTTRPEALAHLPTFDEAGVKDFYYEPWYGMFVPKGTPDTIMDTLHGAVNRANLDPDARQKLLEQGLVTENRTRAEFRQLVESDARKWGEIIDRLKLN